MGGQEEKGWDSRENTEPKSARGAPLATAGLGKRCGLGVYVYDLVPFLAADMRTREER